MIFDYQHGGGGFFVYANSKSDLEEALNVRRPDSGITIFSEDVDQHPIVPIILNAGLIYDLDNPRGVLAALIRDAHRRSS